MDLTPDTILRAYAAGVFPMAESRDDPEIFWVNPDKRGHLPLDQFHVSRSLKKVVRRGVFEIRYNTAFRSVILACAESRVGRDNTWINDEIVTLYSALYQMGHAHSVECWQNERLVGGLYGLSLGGALRLVTHKRPRTSPAVSVGGSMMPTGRWLTRRAWLDNLLSDTNPDLALAADVARGDKVFEEAIVVNRREAGGASNLAE